MKLNAVSTHTTKQNNLNRQNNSRNQNTHFKGAADAATVFWNIVDAGGRGAQFTVEDMLGTNFPRTYQGAMSGYKYTKKVNWSSVMQEGIREFLTGPTMTMAPIGILYLATKMSGETANTHVENISNLSYLTSTLKFDSAPNKETFKNSYFKTIVEDLLKNSTGKEIDESDVKALVEGINKYADTQTALQAKKLAKADKKAIKKQASEILDDLSSTFETILKRNNESYKGLNFQAVKYTISKNGDEISQGSASFKNYIKYLTAFKDDYITRNTIKNDAGEEVINLTKDAISAFKKSWMGKRALTIISMIALTGVVMSIIPKLYTLASGSVNPNAANIYDEAKKREGE